jgi:hypothetical protein
MDYMEHVHAWYRTIEMADYQQKCNCGATRLRPPLSPFVKIEIENTPDVFPAEWVN